MAGRKSSMTQSGAESGLSMTAKCSPVNPRLSCARGSAPALSNARAHLSTCGPFLLREPPFSRQRSGVRSSAASRASTSFLFSPSSCSIFTKSASLAAANMFATWSSLSARWRPSTLLAALRSKPTI
eukprot:scaffold305988_cov30-Tisochrysis_lutea.AAC.1